MRRRVPPGDSSQLTTTADSFFSTPPGKQGGTAFALTEPRAHTVALLDATQAVQTAVESGKVTVTQARQLVDMPPEKQRETVKQLEAAAEGVTGHEKARRQRAVLGDTKPRLKSRKEITQTLQNATGDYAAALRWVLGDDKAPD